MQDSIIELRGNEAMLIERTVTKKVLIEDVLASLAKNTVMVTDRLPNNCIMLGQNQDNYCYVVEMMPSIRTISYTHGKSSGRVLKEYSLALPWMYFICTVKSSPNALTNIGVVFTKDKVVGPKSEVGHMCFPNVYIHQSKGRICLGSVTVPDGLTVSEIANNVIEQFIGGKFNSDLFYAFDDKADMKIIVDNRISQESIHAMIKAESESKKPRTKLVQHLEIGLGSPAIQYLLTWEDLTRKHGVNLFQKFNLNNMQPISYIIKEHTGFDFLQW